MTWCISHPDKGLLVRWIGNEITWNPKPFKPFRYKSMAEVREAVAQMKRECLLPDPDYLRLQAVKMMKDGSVEVSDFKLIKVWTRKSRSKRAIQ